MSLISVVFCDTHKREWPLSLSWRETFGDWKECGQHLAASHPTWVVKCSRGKRSILLKRFRPRQGQREEKLTLKPRRTACCKQGSSLPF